MDCKRIEKLVQSYTSGETPRYPVDGITRNDRVVGALLGAFIGDALGNGCLWYYDLRDLWESYGLWIDGYRDPQRDRPQNEMIEIAAYKYKMGLRAGFASQTGQLLRLTLESLLRCKGFERSDYVMSVENFFREEILPTAQFEIGKEMSTVGKTYCGEGISCFSGRYTNREVRENFDLWYHGGKMDGNWSCDSTVSTTTTSDGAQMAIPLACIYSSPLDLIEHGWEFLRCWYSDGVVLTQSLSFLLTLQGILNGVSLENMMEYLTETAFGSGELGKKLSSFDDITLCARFVSVAKHRACYSFDDRFAPLLFGENCHVTSVLSCASYLAYTHIGDFKKTVLSAVNGGGQNMARAAIAGALGGAMTGIRGISGELLQGLQDYPTAIPKGYESLGSWLLEKAGLLSALVQDKASETGPKNIMRSDASCEG